MNDGRQVKWLHDRLREWVDAGIVTSGQADTIRIRHPMPSPGIPWGIVLFTTAGAAIFGLGVILLFAYNWSVMPKFAKLGIVFGSILLSHGAGLWLRSLGGRLKPLGESLSLLGTMLFGAGIWLVAQIYNIDEHYPTGFLAWGIGALALAVALPSTAQSVTASILLTIWAGSEFGSFHTPTPTAPLLILAVLWPHAWLTRSPVAFAVAIPAFVLSLLFCAGAWIHDSGGVVTALMVNAAALLLGLSMAFEGRSASFSTVARVYGWILFVAGAFPMTFADFTRAWRHGSWEWWDMAAPATLWCALFLPAAALWIYAIRTRQSRRPTPIFHWLVPLSAMMSAWTLLPNFVDAADIPLATAYNLVLLAAAAAFMAEGCRKPDVLSATFGCFLLAILIFARYFDLFHSLLLRGALFLVVGAAIFTEGVLFLRANRMRKADLNSKGDAR